MCQLEPDAFAAMTNAELAEFIREHNAAMHVMVDPAFDAPELKHWEIKKARSGLHEFIERSVNDQGGCDPFRLQKGVKHGYPVLRADTYVLPRAAVEEMVRRLEAMEPAQ